MKKTHNKSRFIQFHANSQRADNLLRPGFYPTLVILQIEKIDVEGFTYLAEVVEEEDYR